VNHNSASGLGARGNRFLRDHPFYTLSGFSVTSLVAQPNTTVRRERRANLYRRTDRTGYPLFMRNGCMDAADVAVVFSRKWHVRKNTRLKRRNCQRYCLQNSDSSRDGPDPIGLRLVRTSPAD